MVVPAVVPDLDKAHAPLDQPAGEQHLAALRRVARRPRRMASGSLFRSKASVAAACILKAIS